MSNGRLNVPPAARPNVWVTWTAIRDAATDGAAGVPGAVVSSAVANVVVVDHAP